jgi:hypothetical protein
MITIFFKHIFLTEDTEIVSLWPDGPYAIPMTKYGCPESEIYGWREGYLSISWEQPQIVYVQVKSADVETDVLPVEPEQVFKTPKEHMHLKTSQNHMKLSFCYKSRKNIIGEYAGSTGSWLNSNFTVYATHEGCPEGNFMLCF